MANAMQSLGTAWHKVYGLSTTNLYDITDVHTWFKGPLRGTIFDASSSSSVSDELGLAACLCLIMLSLLALRFFSVWACLDDTDASDASNQVSDEQNSTEDCTGLIKYAIDTLYAELSNLRSKNDKTEAMNRNLESCLETADDERRKLESSLEATNDDNVALCRKIADVLAERSQFAARFDTADDEIDDLNRKVAEVRTERDELLFRLEAADNDKVALQHQIIDNKMDFEKLESQLEATGEQCIELNQRVADMKTERNGLKRDIYREKMKSRTSVLENRDLKSDIETKEAELKTLRKKLDEQKQTNTFLDGYSDLQDQGTPFAGISLKALGDPEKMRLRKKIQDLEKANNKIKSEFNASENQRRMYASELNELKAAHTDLAAKNNDLEDTKHKLETALNVSWANEGLRRRQIGRLEIEISSLRCTCETFDAEILRLKREAEAKEFCSEFRADRLKILKEWQNSDMEHQMRQYELNEKLEKVKEKLDAQSVALEDSQKQQSKLEKKLDKKRAALALRKTREEELLEELDNERTDLLLSKTREEELQKKLEKQAVVIAMSNFSNFMSGLQKEKVGADTDAKASETSSSKDATGGDDKPSVQVTPSSSPASGKSTPKTEQSTPETEQPTTSSNSSANLAAAAAKVKLPAWMGTPVIQYLLRPADSTTEPSTPPQTATSASTDIPNEDPQANSASKSPSQRYSSNPKRQRAYSFDAMAEGERGGKQRKIDREQVIARLMGFKSGPWD